jgi:MFS superfamily sulfate permease-like transporter
VFTYVVVVVFGVDLGLLIAVLFSIIVVIIRTQRPKVERLGNMHGTDIYRDCKRYLAAKGYDGIEIFRFNSVLYYVNKDFFREKLVATTKVDPDVVISEIKKEKEAILALEKKAQEPKKSAFSFLYRRASGSSDSVDSVAESSSNSMQMPAKKRKASCCAVKKLNQVGSLHSIIIDCSPFTFIDLPAVNMLKSLCKSYKEIGVAMILANVSTNVRDALTLNGYYEISGEDGDFISIHDAVSCARHKSDEKKKEMEADGEL